MALGCTVSAKITISRGELYKLYVAEQRSTAYCAEHFGVSPATIGKRLREFSIPARPKGRQGKYPIPVPGEQVKGTYLILVEDNGFYCKEGHTRAHHWCTFRCSFHECGKVISAVWNNVRSGISKSCGCYQRWLATTSLHGRTEPLPKAQAAVNACYWNHKGNAHSRGYESAPYEEWYHLSQEPCFYCLAPPSQICAPKSSPNAVPFVYSGIDRIDNSLGYPGNSVPCCATCNRAKGALSMEEWLEHMQRAYAPHHYARVAKWYAERGIPSPYTQAKAA